MRPPPTAAWPRFDLADAHDLPFLWEMLTYAASMTPGGAASVADAQADPYLRTYVEGWGRPDDLGIIARAGAPGPGDHDHDHDARIGAAWLRAGLIVAEPGAPELATAMVPAQRGRGIGALMMEQLFQRAAGRFEAVTLSVRAANPALRFYQRLGFQRTRELTNRVGGVSFVMRRPLR